jgi:hypothetical protein
MPIHFALKSALIVYIFLCCSVNLTLGQTDSIKQATLIEIPDSSKSKNKVSKTFNKNHSPKRALILSFALPGAGQIYNRKFWKLPIVYGGLGGLTYLAIFNGTKYQCYRKSYLAMVDDDPLTVNTCDPNQSAADMKLYRDSYQKNYEYSVAGLVGFYLLVAADAFVDAHLKSFDISNDLSLKIKPDLDFNNFSYFPNNSNLMTAGLSFEFNLKSKNKSIGKAFY